ncbi:hypothetical protein [Methanoregula sp.]|nr:hypothetical protein [Methanoregula sp.]MDD1686364.1 hypothetical protein [Methanoregula sp.]
MKSNTEDSQKKIVLSLEIAIAGPDPQVPMVQKYQRDPGIVVRNGMSP